MGHEACQPWAASEVALLRRMIDEQRSVLEIASATGRLPRAVCAKANAERLTVRYADYRPWKTVAVPQPQA